MNKKLHHVRVAPVKAISLKALFRQSLESIGSANAPIGGRVPWAELRLALGGIIGSSWITSIFQRN